MGAVLSSAHERLARANGHVKRIDAVLDQWGTKSGACRFWEELDPRTRERVLFGQISSGPPAELSLLVSECLFMLRSALDHLAYGLALAHTGDPLPTTVAEGSEFPIFGDRPMRDSERTRKIGAIHPDARAVIETLQPYQRGDDYPLHPLWVLHELRRIDHHRLPLQVLGSASPAVSIGGNVMVNNLEIGGGVRADNRRAELIRYQARPLDSRYPMKMQFDIGVGVSLGEGVPRAHEPVTVVLRDLCRYVRDSVFPPLEPFG